MRPVAFPSGHLLAKHGVWPLVPVDLRSCSSATSACTRLRAAARHRLARLRCHSLCGHRHFLPGGEDRRPRRASRAISSYGSSIHSTIVQIGSPSRRPLFVGIMSGDVTHLMAGDDQGRCLRIWLSHTLLIAIGILIVAVILTVVYASRAPSEGKTAATGSTTNEKAGRDRGVIMTDTKDAAPKADASVQSDAPTAAQTATRLRHREMPASRGRSAYSTWWSTASSSWCPSPRSVSSVACRTHRGMPALAYFVAFIGMFFFPCCPSA